MTQDGGIQRLKMVLLLLSITYLFYGVSFLLLPGLLSSMSGDPVHLGWIRWSGGPLIALGIGAARAYRDPAREGGFILIAINSALLIGVALLYSKIFEPRGKHAWFTLTPSASSISGFSPYFSGHDRVRRPFWRGCNLSKRGNRCNGRSGSGAGRPFR